MFTFMPALCEENGGGNKQRVDEMLASSTSCSIHKRYWACEHYLAFHTKGPLQKFLSNWSFNLHLGKQ